jgi:SAM-dependent methyltransferase
MAIDAMAFPPLPEDRAELAALCQRLTEANAGLREEAERRVARLRAVTRYYTVGWNELMSFIWRHYTLSRDLFGPPNPTPLPPREIPPELMDRFTLGGRVPIEYGYNDLTYPNNWPLIYTDLEIDAYLAKIERREWFIYGHTDIWLWEAIEKYPVRDRDVVNIGSNTPWYEANCLHHGARPTTIDYNAIVSLSDRIKTMTVAEWEATTPTFDVAWSISSFEHDGLGTYGDPLDPDGDLKAMQKMKRIVKPGGLLFLAVPIGSDKIQFNSARIYGRLRLPMLLAGWEKIDEFGMAPEHLDGPGHVQPILVLRNS